ncbi:MAG: hypothetical protein SPD11_07030 [Sphaerochaetaceae bacterium]|nr:hypothetical protein [Sphaerochaetaceae bacterium]
MAPRQSPSGIGNHGQSIGSVANRKRGFVIAGQSLDEHYNGDTDSNTAIQLSLPRGVHHHHSD